MQCCIRSEKLTIDLCKCVSAAQHCASHRLRRLLANSSTAGPRVLLGAIIRSSRRLPPLEHPHPRAFRGVHTCWQAPCGTLKREARPLPRCRPTRVVPSWWNCLSWRHASTQIDIMLPPRDGVHGDVHAPRQSAVPLSARARRQPRLVPGNVFRCWNPVGLAIAGIARLAAA